MTGIKISDKMAKEVQTYAKVSNRTMDEQIEYWLKIGKIAEDNPEMTYNDIKDKMHEDAKENLSV
jgi:hypothetical protein